MNMLTTVITPEAEKYLEALVAELEIPKSRYEQATSRYISLGEWLHRDASAIRKFDPQVYVQGSFRHGTAIKPLTEREEYDVDSVVELRRLLKSQVSQATLKRAVGAEITAYARAHGMERPVRERRRCWTLDYADGAQFHLDAVPALSNGQDQRVLLEARGLDQRWADTAIAITDNETPNYEQITNGWPRSNPKGYGKWFRERVVVAVERRRRAGGVYADVESMPTYKIKTPLQSAIMILKRHRDMMFVGRGDERPISIILTTLAAHAYNGELTVGTALVAILARMDHFIQFVDGRYVIPNPTDPLENFADKWEAHPERAEAFFEWLLHAREQFTQAARLSLRQQITEVVASGVGRPVAERARDRSFGLAAPALLTEGIVRNVAEAQETPVRLEGGGRNA